MVFRCNADIAIKRVVRGETNITYLKYIFRFEFFYSRKIGLRVELEFEQLKFELRRCQILYIFDVIPAIFVKMHLSRFTYFNLFSYSKGNSVYFTSLLSCSSFRGYPPWLFNYFKNCDRKEYKGLGVDILVFCTLFCFLHVQKLLCFRHIQIMNFD